ncbi:MAG: tetratricopeptide repeat protein [Deltaproteobacteria bacterium]|nr:tetratricopeptide repeat protein [Deltaproteobacteria bacterium]
MGQVLPRRMVGAFADRRLVVAATLIGGVLATSAGGASAEEPAPPAAAPPAAAPATAAPPVDPLAEPRDLIEHAPNTKENLRRAIALYEERLGDASLPAQKRADGWADASRAWLRLGDVETVEAKKIEAYTAGRAAAKKGLAAVPNHVESLFWDMANLATTGRTRGVMNSLFMLPELRKGLQRCLELDRNHKLCKQTLADVDHAVPGIAGGSDERAEQAYLELLKRDPGLTSAMFNLAKLYRDQGKKEEARRWATQARDAKSPSSPNDWKKFDRNDASQLLKELDK